VAFENGVSMSPVGHITTFLVPLDGMKQSEIAPKGIGCKKCKILIPHFYYLRVGASRGTSVGRLVLVK
jgi:hypothetical protein